ncbi:multiple epidermal growth factor-like domains protein 6 [Mytilus californianus]|uniref:multiple epidermal growth factor-like domains protein 6 n=1 Tax=Mytilus californianus TaxID=6549 RepID=UPI002246C3E5|nr:multiple epidermal growth factor-like domains protein 6 [Mytilus californianus]
MKKILRIALLSIITATFIVTVAAQLNLAPQGFALQRTTYPGRFAHLAIEGPANNKKTDGCANTAANQRYAWWGLQLPAVAHMTNILIYFREDYPERMDEFRLYLGNGTADESKDSNRCYTDLGIEGQPNITQNITCNMLAKNMYFVNRRPSATCFVELCYVAIYGCFKGSWSTNCTKSCPATCISNYCYPQNGSCVWGCDKHNCFNNKCDINTGACIEGCIALRAGQYCNKYNLASNGTATQNQPKPNHPASLAIDGNRTKGLCSMTIGSGSHLQVDTGSLSVVTTVYFTFGDTQVTTGEDIVYCSNTSDSWDNGILLYKGERPTKDINVYAVCRYIIYVPPAASEVDVCEFEIGGCPLGRYGDNCEKFCHCNGPCDLVTGNCTSGCLDGWIGYRCDIVCANGNFGSKCSRHCSANCLNEPCHHVSGECTGGCNEGWEGYHCTKECDVGYFGINCSQTCFGCISNQCDKVNGVCNNSSECKPGFVKGQNCNQECEDWKFGKDCAKECNCRTVPCNKFNGLCSNGECAKGWHGETCDNGIEKR